MIPSAAHYGAISGTYNFTSNYFLYAIFRSEIAIAGICVACYYAVPILAVRARAVKCVSNVVFNITPMKFHPLACSNNTGAISDKV